MYVCRYREYLTLDTEYSRTLLVRPLLMSNTWLGSMYKDMIPQLITHNTNLRIWLASTTDSE